ncbi:MAG: cobalamin-dependent protein, partial [Proteobacteria bacterium]|nr:cobalamin-dependent protein [Pseudomonadota bacterium]
MLEFPVRKVLLINPPGRCLIGRDGKILERKHCHPHLGLAYLAASLIKFDYQVEVIDMLAEGYENERYTEHFVFYGLSFDDTIERIRKSNPGVIGVSVLFSNLAMEANRLVQEIKKAFPGTPIVMGGHHPSAAPLHVMKNPDVDYVLTGESDLTIVELCDA